MEQRPAIDVRRALAGVLIGELIPVAVLVAVVAVWGPSPPAEARDFARRLGLWVGPLVGALTVFLVGFWAGRGSARPVVQGALIGGVVALIDLSLLALSGEVFRPVFAVSNGARVLAGAVGGWVWAARAVGAPAVEDLGDEVPREGG